MSSSGDKSMDHVRVAHLDDLSRVARETREQISSTLQKESDLRSKLEPLRASMRRAKLLLPAVVDRRLSAFRINSWMFWGVLLLQLLLIMLMYRVSIIYIFILSGPIPPSHLTLGLLSWTHYATRAGTHLPRIYGIICRHLRITGRPMPGRLGVAVTSRRMHRGPPPDLYVHYAYARVNGFCVPTQCIDRKGCGYPQSRTYELPFWRLTMRTLNSVVYILLLYCRSALYIMGRNMHC
ncbi:hypothetical protein BD779DRAFT_142950 [Infundibulicybe gibba]|nr:hypothetical protein BD779DRAFT_142950 [Infundibulicybe gibba]